jgi:WD40 repeat protein/serine/threonine protein kinase
MTAPEKTELDEVLAAYLEGVEAGWAVPDLARLQACYPHMAEDLARFFADQQRVERVTRPLRPATGLGAAPTLSCAGGPAPTRPGEGALPSVAGYELLEELGHGGMGLIYRARHQASGRTVALKMIRAGALSAPEERERFRAEVRAVAALRHPGIVTLYDVGDVPSGPYYTMEYVEGGSLADHLDGTPLRPDDAARLVRQVAEAIHVAHQQGIVHRDLKPQNVLLSFSRETPASAAPGALAGVSRLNEAVPKIADFGLARRADVPGHTASGAIVGTPSYMAPEQAESKKHAIGPRADVWALGAILYEMLTGRPPFKAATALDTILQVIGEEPVPPGQLQPRTPADLETICLKCLDKDPGKRYATALDLADDLGRFLRRESVRARPISQLAQAWRWCRRNPAVAALLAAVLVVLAAGASVASVFAVLAEQHARAEEQERERAQGAEALAVQRAEDEGKAHKDADEQRGRAKDEAVRAEHEKEEAQRQLNLARRHLMTVQLLRVQAEYERHPDKALELLFDTNACPADLRDAAWGFYERRCRRERLSLNWSHWSGYGTTVAFSPDGRLLAAAGDGESWPEGVQRAVSLVGLLATTHGPAPLAAVKVAAEKGERHTWFGEVRIWDAATGREAAVLRDHLGGVSALAFSPDGSTLATGGYDGLVRLWGTADAKQRAVLASRTQVIYALAFGPDGRTLASAEDDGAVRLWDVATGAQRAELRGHAIKAVSLAFSPDGKTLASASRDHTVRLWDTTAARERATLKGHTGAVTFVAFSRDGQTVASAGSHEFRLWNATTGQERTDVRTSQFGHFHRFAVSPDGATVAVGNGGELRLCDAGTGQEKVMFRDLGADSLAFSPDGRTLASAGEGRVRLWDVSPGQERAILKGGRALAFSPDGKVLASGGDQLVLWDPRTAAKRAVLSGPQKYITALAFCPDGKTLVSGGFDGTLQVWDVETGRKGALLKRRQLPIQDLAFSPDGQSLVSACASGLPPSLEGEDPEVGEVLLWDLTTGRSRPALRGFTGYVDSIAFSPDGKTLATSGRDWRMGLWDFPRGTEQATFQIHGLRKVRFSPDGKMVAYGYGLGRIQILDANTRRPQVVLAHPGSPATQMAFAPQGKGVATGHDDGAVRLWDPVTGQERAVLRGHAGGVTSVIFSPDGEVLASAGYDGTVRLWDVATSR